LHVFSRVLRCIADLSLVYAYLLEKQQLTASLPIFSSAVLRLREMFYMPIAKVPLPTKTIVGAETKLTDALTRDFVELLAQGNTIKDCCSATGISVPTYSEWIQLAGAIEQGMTHDQYSRIPRDPERL